MSNLIHRLAALVGGLAVLLPAVDQLPGTTSPAIKFLVAAIGGLALLLTKADKVKPQKGAPPVSTLMLLLLPVIGMLGLSGCHIPAPKPPSIGSVVQCVSESVAKNAPTLLPEVNECLAGKGDVSSCLMNLVSPGFDVLACLVQHEFNSATMASSRNPDDRVDARRAARAKEFLDRYEVKFAPPPTR